MSVEYPCPECGHESEPVSSNLSALGYTAEDVTHQCTVCDYHWVRGVPRGEFDHAIVEETRCPSCDEFGYAYQFHDGVDGLAIRFKCPGCYHVWIREREFVNGGITLGYPFLLGATDGTKPWGYEREK